MSNDMLDTAQKKEVLVIPDKNQIVKELDLLDREKFQVGPEENRQLNAKAEEIVKVIINFDAGNIKKQNESKEAVENLGFELQKKAQRENQILKQSINTLSKRSEDGGTVANELINLKEQVEALDPGKFDFEAGWFTRALGRIPGIGTPLKRYFTKYESAQTVIGAIIRALEEGRGQLVRDNQTLSDDQVRMRETSLKLQKAVKIAQLIDQKIQEKLNTEIPPEDVRYKFIQEELLFPLRQRTIALQEQIVVDQQSVVAMEIIIRNNKELVRGVNRALNVTVTALGVAVTVALALANQKIVLDKINALNSTTNKLLESNAARLKSQGTEIHKMASSAQLDLDNLKNCFVNINSAIEDISKFRRESLPNMAGQILLLSDLTDKAEKSIKSLEKGNNISPDILIDLE